jgi:MFS family permease
MTTLDLALPRPLWRQPDFAKLWAGQSVSQLGDQVTVVALPLLALGVLHASAAGVALLVTLSRLAFLPLGLPAGVWVDRLGRRRVMVAADVLRALALLSLPVAAVSGVLSYAQLALVALLLGVGTVFFEVAYPSYVPGLLRRLGRDDGLLAANTRLELSRSTAAVAGPGVAGLLVGAAGAVAAVFVDALSFVVSVLSLVAIGHAEPPVAHRSRVRGELGTGLRFLVREPVLRTLLLCGGAYNLCYVMVESLLVAYATRALGLGATATGLVLAVAAVGFPVGTLLAAPLVRRLGAGPAVIAGAALAVSGPLLYLPATAAHPVPWLVAGGLLLGVGQACFNVPYLSLRQAATPEALLGRVNAAFRFVTWGALPLGSALGALLVQALGLRATIAVAAVGSAVCLPILLGNARLRRTAPTRS